MSRRYDGGMSVTHDEPVVAEATVAEDGKLDLRPYGYRPGETVRLMLSRPAPAEPAAKAYPDPPPPPVDPRFPVIPLPPELTRPPTPDEIAETKRRLAEMRARFKGGYFHDPYEPAINPNAWHAIGGEPAAEEPDDEQDED